MTLCLHHLCCMLSTGVHLLGYWACGGPPCTSTTPMPCPTFKLHLRLLLADTLWSLRELKYARGYPSAQPCWKRSRERAETVAHPAAGQCVQQGGACLSVHLCICGGVFLVLWQEWGSEARLEGMGTLDATVRLSICWCARRLYFI